ncbi:C-X-C motif chemokine 17 [Ornithorhynchus anatinus]|uniref:C-X-C motif chemokine 17 n=1 Tax=Ornithorhynchus anatinus TaxID=9258 RepID=UPI0010A84683|nr:C-X-C motif chemokine 17 [Ornithorhynchus anatinus]
MQLSTWSLLLLLLLLLTFATVTSVPHNPGGSRSHGERRQEARRRLGQITHKCRCPGLSQELQRESRARRLQSPRGECPCDNLKVNLKKRPVWHHKGKEGRVHYRHKEACRLFWKQCELEGLSLPI